MKYPGASINEDPHISLPEAVFNHFGTYEVFHDTTYVPRPKAQLFAMHLGRACIEATRNRKRAKVLVRKARTNLKERNGREDTAHAMRLQLQNIYGDMVHFAENKQAFFDRRTQHYEATIDALEVAQKRVCNARNEHAARDWIGFTNEVTALAVFNRYAHPWMIAVPALNHHDNGSEARANYDLALITSSPTREAASYQKLQVKSNLSNGGARNCASDIGLVDASARFGYRYDSVSSEFPVADMLVREFYDEATPAEVKQLDVITDNLLLDLSSQSA